MRRAQTSCLLLKSSALVIVLFPPHMNSKVGNHQKVSMSGRSYHKLDGEKGCASFNAWRVEGLIQQALQYLLNYIYTEYLQYSVQLFLLQFSFFFCGTIDRASLDPFYLLLLFFCIYYIKTYSLYSIYMQICSNYISYSIMYKH